MKMERVTEKQLQMKVDSINQVTGSPAAPYADGKAQIGCFHVSHAYGGVSLHRMSNEAGGVHNVFGQGHGPKRELMESMRAYLLGYDASNS